MRRPCLGRSGNGAGNGTDLVHAPRLSAAGSLLPPSPLEGEGRGGGSEHSPHPPASRMVVFEPPRPPIASRRAPPSPRWGEGDLDSSPRRGEGGGGASAPTRVRGTSDHRLMTGSPGTQVNHQNGAKSGAYSPNWPFIRLTTASTNLGGMPAHESNSRTATATRPESRGTRRACRHHHPATKSPRNWSASPHGRVVDTTGESIGLRPRGSPSERRHLEPGSDRRPLDRTFLRRMGMALASHLEKEGMVLNHLRFLEVTLALHDAIQVKRARGQMPTGIPADLKPMIRLIVGEPASD